MSESSGEHPLQNVACVDDDADILHVAALSLGVIGRLQVTCFEGAIPALDGLAAARPDLVLLDVMMPAMDGPATLRAMSSRPDLAKIPVIFMTARVQPSEAEQYLALGAIGVIRKPFNPVTLADEVREVWSRWWSVSHRGPLQAALYESGERARASHTGGRS